MKLRITEGELVVFALNDRLLCDAKNIFYRNKPNIRLRPNMKVFDLNGLDFERLLVLSMRSGTYPPKISIDDILEQTELTPYTENMKVVADIFKNNDGTLDVNIIDSNVNRDIKDFVSRYYIKSVTKTT